MKKLYALVAAATFINAAAFCAGWDIDRPMRFSLAYVPAALTLPNNPQAQTSLQLSAASEPDITNINLAEIKSLGFSLPGPGGKKNERDYNLFLKLYEFPASLRPNRTVLAVIEDFRLDRIGGGKIYNYALNRSNDAVKFGVIAPSAQKYSEQNPFPAFLLDKKPKGSDFMKKVPFASLYVVTVSTETPGPSEDEKARFSAQGVLALHKEVLASYSKILRPVKCGQTGYTCFYDDGYLIKVREPMVFDNWPALPMPTDPKHHFLSGLLLIYRNEIYSDGVPGPSFVFEIGSVYKTQPK